MEAMSAGPRDGRATVCCVHSAKRHWEIRHMSLIPVLREIFTSNVGGDRIRYLARGVVWQCRKRLGHTFVTTLPNGARVLVQPNSSYSSIFYSKWPEGKDVQFFRKNSHLGDVFVDVGANVGLFSALLFDSFRHFILFEPSPSSYQAIEATLRLNPEVSAKAVNIGVADVVGELAFLDLGACSSTSRFVGDGAYDDQGRVVKVACDTLDNQLASVIGQLILKIDVEGFEEKVFLGASRLLREKRVRLAMFERLGRTNLGRVRLFLESFGYRLFFVNEDGSMSFDDEAISRPMVNLFVVHGDRAKELLG